MGHEALHIKWNYSLGSTWYAYIALSYVYCSKRGEVSDRTYGENACACMPHEMYYQIEALWYAIL